MLFVTFPAFSLIFFKKFCFQRSEKRSLTLLYSGRLDNIEERRRTSCGAPAVDPLDVAPLGVGPRQNREWFTVSLLAQALHISRPEVQKWIDRGWLRCRAVQVQSVTRRIIDAEDFCLFVKNHGRAVIGNRLSYEGLAFVRDYVFPRPHADLLLVRGPYGRGKKPAHADEAALHEEDECDGQVTGQSA